MYTFLLASLPTLEIGHGCPLAVGDFDAACTAAMIPEKERCQLMAFDGVLPPPEKETDEMPRVYREFIGFEKLLRAHIARIRSARAGAPLPPAPEAFDADAASRLTQAAALPPLERERAVDELRWRKIDEIEAFHAFDFDALCAYRLRLLLLSARSRRDMAHGRDVFTALLDEKAAMV